MPGSIPCTKCRTQLLPEVFTESRFVLCPQCRSPLRAEIFPAFFRPRLAGVSGQAILSETESSCFYHPQKKAVVPCEGCGRFLCSLCDVELNGQHLCVACLESGKKKGRIKNLQNHRMLYDKIALLLAFLPILLWPFTIFTAPAALFLAVRYWKAPRSLTNPSKSSAVLAIVFASLQIAAWLAVLTIYLSKRF